MDSETWLLVGSSRGLGFEFFQWARKQTVRPTQMILVSRSLDRLAKIESEESLNPDQWRKVDLSKSDDLMGLIESLEGQKIDRLVYFAGGGPYGKFSKKAWKDHEWAWKVSFVGAARLLHSLMSSPHLRQAIFIGSEIAENRPDPGAASYAAAKHALRGLISTLQLEPQDRPIDLRMFSPGYMNTELLPPHSKPRTQGLPIVEPKECAHDLWVWMQDSKHFCDNWSKS